MVVLHTMKYRESSLIIHGYTKESGRESMVLKGVSRKGGLPLLHPLSIIEYSVSDSKYGSMKNIRDFSAGYRLDSIRGDIRKNIMAMFISELLYRTVVLPEKDERLYGFIEDAVLKLENISGNIANFHIWFTDRYISMIGFPMEKGFESFFNPFDDELAALLSRVHGSGFDEAMRIPMTGKSRSGLISAMLKYIEYHTGTRVELRSLPVLRSITEELCH